MMYLQRKVTDVWGVGIEMHLKAWSGSVFEWNLEVWNYFMGLIVKFDVYAHIVYNWKVWIIDGEFHF